MMNPIIVPMPVDSGPETCPHCGERLREPDEPLPVGCAIALLLGVLGGAAVLLGRWLTM